MSHTTPHRSHPDRAPTCSPGCRLVAVRERRPALAPLGDFAHHQDIGAPKLAGSATWNAASQEYVLTAAGVNLWGKRDEFHYAWRRLTGDFILQVRVEFVGQGVDPHRKAGFLVRGSLDEDAPYADAVVHGDGLTSLQSRREKGGLTEQIVSATKGADFLQLERRGNRYTMSAARFGEPLAHECPRGAAARRRGLRRPLPLLAQPRRRRAGDLPRRADHPARQGRLHAVPRLHRQRAGDPGRGDGPAAGRAALGGALRGPELDDRRRLAHLQQQRPRRGPGPAAPLRPRDPHLDA